MPEARPRKEREKYPPAAGAMPNFVASVDGSQRNLKGEDAHAAHTMVDHGETLEMFLVADGHGGPTAAKLVADTLLFLIAEEASGPGPAELEAACLIGFRKMHAKVHPRLTYV